eukprot:836164_1
MQNIDKSKFEINMSNHTIEGKHIDFNKIKYEIDRTLDWLGVNRELIFPILSKLIDFRYTGFLCSAIAMEKYITDIDELGEDYQQWLIKEAIMNTPNIDATKLR